MSNGLLDGVNGAMFQVPNDIQRYSRRPEIRTIETLTPVDVHGCHLILGINPQSPGSRELNP